MSTVVLRRSCTSHEKGGDSRLDLLASQMQSQTQTLESYNLADAAENYVDAGLGTEEHQRERCFFFPVAPSSSSMMPNDTY